MPNIIEVDQLVKRYPRCDQPAVRNASFAVRRGEIFGLLGPAGAGKTTILAMLSGSLKPDGGTITIAGFDLFRQATDIKRLVRFVPPKFALFPLLSLRDNLLWYGRLHGMIGKQLKPRSADVLKFVRLVGGCADKRSGNRQWRISLAAALLHQPEILLLDEPMLNIDPTSRDDMLQIVTEINQRGVTIVYVTRAGAEAARLCHRVALIDQGRIVALDTPRALHEMVNGDLAMQANLDAVFVALTGKHLHE